MRWGAAAGWLVVGEIVSISVGEWLPILLDIIRFGETYSATCYCVNLYAVKISFARFWYVM